jgi:hypothetical protein
VVGLVIFYLARSVFYDWTPKHEVVPITFEILPDILDISGELIGELLNVVGTLILNVLKSSSEMNCHFTNV